MFIGHYGPALLLKRYHKDTPLWALLLAVQFLDVIFFVLVPLGIESLRIDPAEKGALALKLDYMPYSHSLLMTGVYALVITLLGYAAGRRTTGKVLAVAITSHWLLDVLVHQADMPISFAGERLGLGLWEYTLFEYILEVFIVCVSAALAIRRFPGANRLFLIFIGILILIQTLNTFIVPLPSSITVLALISQVIYLAVACFGYFIERASTRDMRIIGN